MVRAKKRLGQNFLVDENILGVIGRLAELADDDVVLEIGPGLGILTTYLADRVAQVYAVEVDTSLDGAQAVLTVTDTGAGIAPGDLPRIWERLFRGDASRTERGLGLGLSLVKAVVEAHGGTVEVASEPGRGTTVTVALKLET